MYAQKKPIENTHIVRERDRRRFRELLAVLALGVPIGAVSAPLHLAEPRGDPPRTRSDAPAETEAGDREREQGAAARARSPHVAQPPSSSAPSTLGFQRTDPRAVVMVQRRRLRSDTRHPTADTRSPLMPISQKRLLQLFAVLAAWAVIVVARLVQIQLVRHGDYVVKARAPAGADARVAAGARLDHRQPRTHPRGERRRRIDLRRSAGHRRSRADREGAGQRRRAADGRARARRETHQRTAASSGSRASFRSKPAPRCKALKLPGIYFLEEHRRSYPRAHARRERRSATSVSTAKGSAGIEHSFDAHVRGRAGRVTLLRDARARHVPRRRRRTESARSTATTSSSPSTPSCSSSPSARWRKRSIKYHAAGGVGHRHGSARRPHSGDGVESDVRSESLPRLPARRIAATAPCRIIYEPGSTFKIVTASAGLEEGVVTPSQILDCGDGFIQIGNTQIHEHGHNRYGLHHLRRRDGALVERRRDPRRPRARAGSLLQLHPPLRFRRAHRHRAAGRSAGTRAAHASSGRSFRTRRCRSARRSASTPLQVVAAIAAVANGGVRVQPRIVEKSRRREGQHDLSSAAGRAGARDLREDRGGAERDPQGGRRARNGRERPRSPSTSWPARPARRRKRARRLLGDKVVGLVRRIRSGRSSAAGDPRRRSTSRRAPSTAAPWPRPLSKRSPKRRFATSTSRRPFPRGRSTSARRCWRRFRKSLRRPRDRKSLTCEASTRVRRWRSPPVAASASAPRGVAWSKHSNRYRAKPCRTITRSC